MLDILTILIRMGITFLASLIYGLERQRAHKPVSFGTFAFVALGSAALGLIVVSDKFQGQFPVSLLGSIVTGIGFLGAGALIRSTDKVFGFTTASSIWLFAIFGLTIGIGEYIIGATIYILVWLIIILDHYLEIKGIGSHQRKLVIITSEMITEKELKSYLVQYTQKSKILSVNIDKEKNELQLTYLVQGSRENLNKMIRNLYTEDWLKSAKIE